MISKGNMFKSFGAAADERERDQAHLEATLTGQTSPRPRKRVNATTITLVISQADKDRVKAFALEQNVSVSDLLHRWIEDYC